jgi:hypothetical protein
MMRSYTRTGPIFNMALERIKSRSGLPKIQISDLVGQQLLTLSDQELDARFSRIRRRRAQ